MTTGEALLRGILDHPEDDDRRLIYADWLEENGDDARAEFIRCVIESIRLRLTKDRVRAESFTSRAAVLFKQNELKWFGIPEWPDRYGYRVRSRWDRGFIVSVGFENTHEFVKHAGVLFSQHPIKVVQLSNYPLQTRANKWSWFTEAKHDVNDHTLPPSLYRFLTGGIGRWGNRFSSREAAQNALRAASLAFGRHAAGLVGTSTPV